MPVKRVVVGTDAHYTPRDLASQLVEACGAEWHRPRIVADFAAGDGALLRAAQQRWPKAQIVATDNSRAQVKRLSRANPDWNVGIADFLSARARRNSRMLDQHHGRVDLVLLNPPFSFRGNHVIAVEIFGKDFRVSPALSFVATALPFISNRGQVVAIMPRSTMTSEKDAGAWSHLRRSYHVELLPSWPAKRFPSVAARTVAVRISVHQRNQTEQITRRPHKQLLIADEPLAVRLVRGCQPMHKIQATASRRALPVIHTTDLIAMRVRPNGARALNPSRTVRGPAVLVQRVGLPSIDKVALYVARAPIVLSDCVVGLECKSLESARRVDQRIRANWNSLRDAYDGTCAPYITVRVLAEVLHDMGISTIA